MMKRSGESPGKTCTAAMVNMLGSILEKAFTGRIGPSPQIEFQIASAMAVSDLNQAHFVLS